MLFYFNKIKQKNNNSTHLAPILLRISLEAYSSKIDVLANRKACFTGLLKAAAVPMGDLGSTPPSEKKQEFSLQNKEIQADGFY